ncbi:2-oxoacid:acceptor oxidoreductase family protein [Candidatus Bathyarchaeota archaeon]|nr:2-oxoacid:acceptor oxidoreductase family protein [Candidatus Bathyarchaeota archaeon]
MVEVRFHGRGGQGVWTASLLLAQAGLREKKYVQSFPAFGPERSGAPVTAYTRMSERPIRIHSGIYNPDVVVVVDPTLLTPEVAEGAKPESKLVANTTLRGREVRGRVKAEGLETWILDASSMAMKILGRPITNTAMLGALIRAVELVKLETLLEVAGERFTGRLKEQNLQLIRAAYEEVVRE